MTLPLCHGAFSICRTSPAEGSAAYLAAAATTHKAMLDGPDAFWPFDRPSGVQLRGSDVLDNDAFVDFQDWFSVTLWEKGLY
jgi:hypothetical protein